MTFLRRAVDNPVSRAYLLAVAAIESWVLFTQLMSSGPSSDVGLALPAVPISLIGAFAVASLGGATGPYWWLFPVSIVIGAVLNAAVIGTLVQARRSAPAR
jgi:hypothetical protein